MSRTRLLLLGAAALPLAACGASDPASPGQGGGGVVVVPAPAPAPAPAPGVGPNTAEAAFATTTVSGVTVTVAEQIAVVNAGTNNVLTGTNPLNGVAPTGSALNVGAFDASTVNPFFTRTSYIGAVNPAGDTWFQGWTCNSSTLNLGPGNASCATGLSRSAAAPAASACPTGTTDAGTANNYRLCRLPAQVSGTLSLPRVDGVAYQLNGRVDVGQDRGTLGTGGAAATLTIAAGAIIVANPIDPAPDFLVVNRGSQINAVGTATQPIIFTSQQNLNPANNGDSSQGQWGGIVIAGRAPIANCSSGTNNADGTSTTCENIVEGTVTALYGGNAPTDSSGTMRYVQIRYSGLELTPGNELQGLTTAGAGSGTDISYIQVHNSSDDGVEVFGGRNSFRYMVVTGADDDGFDVDTGWRGLVQFLIVAQKLTGATTDSFATEIDSNGNEDALPRTYGQYANFTFIQTANAPAAIRLRGGADFGFYNGIVKSVAACANIVAGTEANGGKSTIRAANAGLQELGAPVFRSVFFACNGN
ncbi:hypothetical protein GVO57_08920 [Sphingomonas changnyeongensis]|uniref:Lipoprotein n=1 Tax=Sphingomonas changnyeongensis TaxID=2698679 RepID=A0A7Z2S813_9SPHN|nr:hypothetical protein [Sphingomonas changnyeongensis]QHL90916.1 hypothetical protein GVO57_08920 [Sphingomonas changnyeongensis]